MGGGAGEIEGRAWEGVLNWLEVRYLEAFLKGVGVELWGWMGFVLRNLLIVFVITLTLYPVQLSRLCIYCFGEWRTIIHFLNCNYSIVAFLHRPYYSRYRPCTLHSSLPSILHKHPSTPPAPALNAKRTLSEAQADVYNGVFD